MSQKLGCCPCAPPGSVQGCTADLLAMVRMCHHGGAAIMGHGGERNGPWLPGKEKEWATCEGAMSSSGLYLCGRSAGDA